MSYGASFLVKDASPTAAVMGRGSRRRPRFFSRGAQGRRRQIDFVRFDENWIGVAAHIVRVRLSRWPESLWFAEARAIRGRFVAALKSAGERRVLAIAAIDVAISRGLAAAECRTRMQKG